MQQDSIPNQRAGFELDVLSPCNAKLTPLNTHCNPMIQDGLLGQGVCFYPLSSQILSPVQGKIIHLPATCDQIRIQHQSGLLIHLEFGIDTRQLMGKSFIRYKAEGDQVTPGDLLFDYNLPMLNAELTSTQSFIGIANLIEKFDFIPYYHRVKAKTDTAFTVRQ